MTEVPGEGLDRLLAVMRRLRAPGGCAWDAEQTFETIAPYTIEEAYEVADAIERGDHAGLCDELGDLQLQVVYHAAIAEDAGLFTIEDVLRGVSDKLVRRHPHVFGDVETPGWEAIKAAERAGSDDRSALAGVARALPALKRAEKIGARAARVGFDWPDVSGSRAKVDEELTELDAAVTYEERAEELGDVLFAVVNLARHLKIDPEAALAAATRKFEARFRTMEAAAGTLDGLGAHRLDRLWREAKRSAPRSAPTAAPAGER